MELNFEVPEMQKWNIPTDRAQWIDEKNGAICLALLFSPESWSFKCQKWLVIFSTDDSKNPVIVWEKYLSASERSHSPLLKNAMNNWFLSYH